MNVVNIVISSILEFNELFTSLFCVYFQGGIKWHSFF
jgi:hypothetical protein